MNPMQFIQFSFHTFACKEICVQLLLITVAGQNAKGGGFKKYRMTFCV